MWKENEGGERRERACTRYVLCVLSLDSPSTVQSDIRVKYKIMSKI